MTRSSHRQPDRIGFARTPNHGRVFRLVDYFFGVPGPMKNHTISPTSGNRATTRTQIIFFMVSAELPKICTAAYIKRAKCTSGQNPRSPMLFPLNQLLKFVSSTNITPLCIPAATAACGRNQPLRFAEFHPIERPLLVIADVRQTKADTYPVHIRDLV